MKNLGNRLLHTYSLINIIEAMPPHLIDAAKQLFAHNPNLSEDELRCELRKWFGLVPLELGALQSIMVNVAPRVVRTGRSPYLYLAEARLSYSGSPLLWRYSPGGDLKFPYRGVAARTSVGLRKFIFSKDVEPFEKEVQLVLAETREQLAKYAATVRLVDETVSYIIDCWLKTLLTYKP